MFPELTYPYIASNNHALCPLRLEDFNLYQFDIEL